MKKIPIIYITKVGFSVNKKPKKNNEEKAKLNIKVLFLPITPFTIYVLKITPGMHANYRLPDC